MLIILTGLQASIGVTHSYSSRPFLSALDVNNVLLSNTARILSSLRAMKEPNNSASMWARVVLMDAYIMLQVEREPLSESSTL